MEFEKKAKDIINLNRNRILEFIEHDKIMFDDEFIPKPIRPVARLMPRIIETEFECEETIIRSEFPIGSQGGAYEGVFWISNQEMTADEIKEITERHYK